MGDIVIIVNWKEKVIFFEKERISLEKTLLGAKECLDGCENDSWHNKRNGRTCVSLIYKSCDDASEDTIKLIRISNSKELNLHIRPLYNGRDLIQIRGDYNLNIEPRKKRKNKNSYETPWEILIQQ